MSETETIKKKEQKQLSIEEAVELLLPICKSWRKVRKEFAEMLNHCYQNMDMNDFKKLFDKIGCSIRTWYNFVEEFGYTLKCVNQAESHRLNAHLHSKEILHHIDVSPNGKDVIHKTLF